MKCQKCGINNVNVRIEKNINGNVTKQYLCSKCADEMNINLDFNVFDFALNSMFNFDFPIYSKLLSNKSKSCKACGDRYNELINYYDSECEECNNIFKDNFEELLNNLHESKRYNSKRYVKLNRNCNEKSEKQKEEENIKDLENKLQLAIKEERYEEAAKIRDELKKIKNKLDK